MRWGAFGWLMLGGCALALLACGSEVTVLQGGTSTTNGCTPGDTKACYGPGQCSGAQVCKGNGTGWGPCNCGTGASGNAGGYGASGNAGGWGASGNAGGYGASGNAGGFGAVGNTGGYGASGNAGGYGASGNAGGYGAGPVGGAGGFGGMGGAGGVGGAGGSAGSAGSGGGVLQWDATSDFSAIANPNGVWSSGWTPTLGGYLTIFQTTVESPYGFPVWVDPAINDMYTPNFLKNTSNATCWGIPPGRVSLHGGCHANEYAVLRWTAPLTASCTVHAQFLAGDSGNTSATILKNSSTTIFSVPGTNNSPSFVGIVNVVPGDTLDFVVGTKGDCYSDSTPVIVTVACS